MTNLKPEEAAMRGLLGVGLIVGLVCMLAGIERAVAGTAPALPMANGSSAAMHNAEGIKHYNLGHWKPAYEHFVEAVQENPDAAEAHYNLALSLDKMGGAAEALAVVVVDLGNVDHLILFERGDDLATTHDVLLAVSEKVVARVLLRVGIGPHDHGPAIRLQRDFVPLAAPANRICHFLPPFPEVVSPRQLR